MQAQMYDSMHHKGRTSMPQKAAAVFIIYHVQRTITAAASFLDDHHWSAAEVAGTSNHSPSGNLPHPDGSTTYITFSKRRRCPQTHSQLNVRAYIHTNCHAYPGINSISPAPPGGGLRNMNARAYCSGQCMGRQDRNIEHLQGHPPAMQVKGFQKLLLPQTINSAPVIPPAMVGHCVWVALLPTPGSNQNWYRSRT